MTKKIIISMGSIPDGAWRRAARVALVLIAGLTASATPRSPFSAPAPAFAAPNAAMRAAQTPDPDRADSTDDDEGNAQPLPVFEDAPSPAIGGARPDSAAILPIGGDSAPAETLRYVPPGERPSGLPAHATRPGDEPVPIVKKPKQGIFGVPPIFLILGLTAVHVFIVQAVTK